MHTGVTVPEKPAYFSRFALKFAEILGAGIATAVGGYLVAHVGAYLSSPSPTSAPTITVEAPANGTAKPAERARNRVTASAPVESDPHAASAHEDRGKETRPAAKPAEASAPTSTATAQPADSDDKRSRGAVASRKPPADAHAAKPALKETAETKPAPKETADAKPSSKETADAKAREEAAVEDQVRAALANVDASRTPSPNTPTAPAAAPPPQTAAIPQPQPIPAPSNAAAPASTGTTSASAAPTLPVPAAAPTSPPLDLENAAAANATATTAPAAASVSAQQAPAEPGPLTTVEVKSLPVAGVGETSQSAQGMAQADNTPDGKAKSEADKGFFSTIAHLPDILRANAHPPAGAPPRPPMPVGE